MTPSPSSFVATAAHAEALRGHQQRGMAVQGSDLVHVRAATEGAGVCMLS